MACSRPDAVIIGAGHAGMSASYLLKSKGIDHVVFEQSRLGDSWRTQRWDTFTLVTPGWMNHLPGFAHPFGDGGFMTRGEVVSYLEGYAATLSLPVREGRRVSAVRQLGDGRFRVDVEDERLVSRVVVVATGAMRRPKIPAWAQALPPGIAQMHTCEYRNPAQLRPGAVLVVGSGQSGCQIAEELLEAGRSVYLSVGRCGRMPRRYRGTDCATWVAKAGYYDQTVDMQRTDPVACNPYVSGKRGGHEINLRKLASRGLRLLGRCQGVADGVVTMADDLEENLAAADLFATKMREAIDAFIQQQGIEAPLDPPEPPVQDRGVEAPSSLPLKEAGIATVIWATGFQQPDFSWIDAPVFDAAGSPVHRRGKVSSPGLYFLGLPWLYKSKSSLIYGIEEDASYVADDIGALLRA